MSSVIVEDIKLLQDIIKTYCEPEDWDILDWDTLKLERHNGTKILVVYLMDPRRISEDDEGESEITGYLLPMKIYETLRLNKKIDMDDVIKFNEYERSFLIRLINDVFMTDEAKLWIKLQ